MRTTATTFAAAIAAWHFHHAATLAAAAGMADAVVRSCQILAGMDNTRQNAAFDAGVMAALKSGDNAVLVDFVAAWDAAPSYVECGAFRLSTSNLLVDVDQSMGPYHSVRVSRRGWRGSRHGGYPVTSGASYDVLNQAELGWVKLLTTMVSPGTFASWEQSQEEFSATHPVLAK